MANHNFPQNVNTLKENPLDRRQFIEMFLFSQSQFEGKPSENRTLDTKKSGIFSKSVIFSEKVH